jgi:hypothetical protein
MRKLRLALLLPIIQGLVQAAFWYWRHARPVVLPNANQINSLDMIPMHPASVINVALNAPSGVATMLLYTLYDFLCGIFWPQRVGQRTGVELVFMLWAFLLWFLIGRWLDLRAAKDHAVAPASSSTSGWLFFLRTIMLVTGATFLFVSFHLGASSFSETIARAILQTWALFLIAAPAITFLRQLNRRDGSTSTIRPPWQVKWLAIRFTNPQLFLSALILLIVLTVCAWTLRH